MHWMPPATSGVSRRSSRVYLVRQVDAPNWAKVDGSEHAIMLRSTLRRRDRLANDSDPSVFRQRGVASRHCQIQPYLDRCGNAMLRRWRCLRRALARGAARAGRPGK